MDHDLIVVGGGPVGASIACAVSGLRTAVLVQERRDLVAAPKTGFDPRVYALSPSNVAFVKLAHAALTPVHAMRIFGDEGAHLEFDAYDAGVPALAYIVEDRVLQDALWDGLDAKVGRWERLSVDEGHARLHLEDGQELTARLVVAADGAESRLRRAAGVAAQSRSYGQTAVVANFRCERPHANTAYQWFQGGPVLALLPLPANHVSMVWSLPADHVLGEGEALCRAVEAATGGALGALELVTPPRSYPLRRLSARRMIAPRMVLVGDAAHVIHPLAGQGLNLGLQDARELAQTMTDARALLDAGDWRLLRRYERARAEPILAMDMMVDGLYRLFGARSTAAASLRNRGLNLTNRLGVVKNLLIRQAMS